MRDRARPAEQTPLAPPAPAPVISGPGLDEHDQAVRDALSEHGGYVVDLFGLFNERDRDDLVEV